MIKIDLTFSFDTKRKKDIQTTNTLKIALNFLNLIGRKKTLFVSTLIVNCLNENGLDAFQMSQEDAKDFANDIIKHRKRNNFTFNASSALTAMAIQGLANQILQKETKLENEEGVSNKEKKSEEGISFIEKSEIVNIKRSVEDKVLADDDVEIIDNQFDDEEELTDEDMDLINNISFFK